MEKGYNEVKFKMAKIGVIGGGSWGTALAILLANKNNDVHIWVRDKFQLKQIEELRENKKYLPDVTIPDEIKITNDISESIYNKDLIVLSVPSHAIREILEDSRNIFQKEQVSYSPTITAFLVEFPRPKITSTI